MVNGYVMALTETDIEFVQKHLKGVDKEEFDLVRAFVQQGGSNEFGGESNIINDDEDSLLENDVSSAEDGARYLQGFYRIGDVPKDIGSDSHFEQILYPERYAESSDGDMIMSPKLSHGIPDDNFKIPDYVAFVHTHGKKTRLTHLFRDDDRGLLLNALRRMRIVNKD